MTHWKQRRLQPELMDQPGLDPATHHQALAGLRRVNAMSRTAGVHWRAMSEVAAQRRVNSFRVLDLASGGGDVALQLAARAQAEEMSVTIEGWDISQTAVDYAARRASAAGFHNVAFAQCDAIECDIGDDFDFVICSLFLHHLERHDAVGVLRRMRQAARVAVLVDDLRRTRAGYALAWLGCRLLTRSPIVHTDGPLSVRAAFTMAEMHEYAREAGLRGASIAPHWPQRFLLKWVRR